MRDGKIGTIIGLGVTLLTIGIMACAFEPLEVLAAKTYDYLLQSRGRLAPPEAVVIADIDEKSLARIGRWPWPRETMAQVVTALSDAGAAIIALDVALSEPTESDPLLATAIGEAGTVILPMVFDFAPQATQPQTVDISGAAFHQVEGSEAFSRHQPLTAGSVTLPVPSLLDAALAVGHINILPDSDGTLRWEPLVVAYQDHLYPSMSLLAAGLYLGHPPATMVVRAAQGITLGKELFIPTDQWGQSLINFYGPDQTFPRVPLCDILEGTIDPARLQDRIVLVGSSAVGIYDLRVTPLAAAMPGVEKHASVIASILEQQFLHKASDHANQGLILAGGLLFSWIVSRLRAMWALAATLLWVTATLLAGHLALVHWGEWFAVSYLIGNTLLVFVSVSAYNYAIEERDARRVRAMFSSYVTERVVTELVKNPNLAKLGGARREVTVLFSDIRGFTTFSESHAPEEVVAQLNEYLGAMTEVIFRWEGTLDKFIGDAILAFWGAPLPQENNAELAFRCALDMVKVLAELQDRWQKEGRPILDCGIGINTGDVLVGNIGKEGKKMDYTVIGDHVNLGSRVEGLTKKYHSRILITEFTLDQIRERFQTGVLGHVRIEGQASVVVKGKHLPVKIYRVQPLPPGTESILQECGEGETVCLLDK